MNKAQQAYLRKVRSYLPCSRKVKNQIMAQIADSVGGYLVEEPEAAYEQLVTRFGEPEAVAAAYVENTGTAEILRALQARRRIVAIVAGVMAAVLLIWAGVVTWAVMDYNKTKAGGHAEIVILEGQTYPEEDPNGSAPESPITDEMGG